MSAEIAPIRLCCDCGMDDALPLPCFRCAACQRDYEIRLAMKLANAIERQSSINFAAECLGMCGV